MLRASPRWPPGPRDLEQREHLPCFASHRPRKLGPPCRPGTGICVRCAPGVSSCIASGEPRLCWVKTGRPALAAEYGSLSLVLRACGWLRGKGYLVAAKGEIPGDDFRAAVQAAIPGRPLCRSGSEMRRLKAATIHTTRPHASGVLVSCNRPPSALPWFTLLCIAGCCLGSSSQPCRDCREQAFVGQ